MLISYHWLKQFVDIKASPSKLAEKITLSLVDDWFNIDRFRGLQCKHQQ